MTTSTLKVIYTCTCVPNYTQIHTHTFSHFWFSSSISLNPPPPPHPHPNSEHHTISQWLSTIHFSHSFIHFSVAPASLQHLFTSSHHCSGSTGAKDGHIIRGRQPDGVSASALSAPSTDSHSLPHSFYLLELHSTHYILGGRLIRLRVRVMSGTVKGQNKGHGWSKGKGEE